MILVSIVRRCPDCHLRLKKTAIKGGHPFVYARMNDFGGFTEDDFCLVFLVFGGMGIVVSGILFLIQDHLARRDQRARIETLLKPTLMAAPKHRPYPVRSLKNHTTIPGGGEPAMTDRTKMTPKRVSPQNSLYDLVRLQIRHLLSVLR